MEGRSWGVSRSAVILGLAIGIIDVLLMLPLAFPDKRAALLGAFSSRFALGFFATVVKLPMSPIASGVLVGVLTSIPDADRDESLRANSHYRGGVRRDRRMGGRPLGGAALTINARHRCPFRRATGPWSRRSISSYPFGRSRDRRQPDGKEGDIA